MTSESEDRCINKEAAASAASSDSNEGAALLPPLPCIS